MHGGRGPRRGAILLRCEEVVVGSVHENKIQRKNMGWIKEGALMQIRYVYIMLCFLFESLEWIIEGQGAFWGGGGQEEEGERGEGGEKRRIRRNRRGIHSIKL